jgi:hypothetical protein
VVGDAEGALEAGLGGVRQRVVADVVEEAGGGEQAQIGGREAEAGADLQAEASDAERVIEACGGVDAAGVEIEGAEEADAPEPREPR